MQIEICAANVGSAINAQKGGADRIELCSELAVGGITPSFGMIKEVLNLIQIPVFVLIRPRSGDFCYSDDEFSAMRTDIEICKDLGCSGIVSGILNPDYTIDKKRTKKLIELTRPLEFTFHRAFDRLANPEKGLNELIDLSADRILTSGQQFTAAEGFELLIRLKDLAQNQIKILPGGGISPTNALLFYQNGFDEIHASVSSAVVRENQNDETDFFGESEFSESNLEKIRELYRILK
ncbi:MAG: copper homeostasis protein CutC [Moheibacter sp.]